jgi:hypothetical protein
MDALQEPHRNRISVQSARLQLPLRDPQVPCQLRIVVTHVRKSALGVPAADENVDGVTKRTGRREAVVDDGEDNHRGSMTEAQLMIEMALQAAACRVSVQALAT